MASPAEDIAAFIAAAFPALVPGTNLFVGQVRAATQTGEVLVPHAAVFVSDEEEDGGEATPYLGADTDCELPVTVTVRGNPGEKVAAKALAGQLRAALHLANVSGYYSCLSEDARPVYMERDDSDCPLYEFTLNVRWVE
jgi:hypothetical protein